MTQENQRSEWKPVKDFLAPFKVEGFPFEYTIVVRVSRSDGFRPKFSICIGRYADKDKNDVMRHIPVISRATNASVTVYSIAKPLSELIEQACDYIRTHAQERENEILEGKIENEKRQLERNRPKKVGGTHA